MKLLVDNGAILAYRRLPYRPWYAIAEFVDNATDAYMRDGNRQLLDDIYAARGERLEVEVVYDRNLSLLRVADNSIGMSESELEAAMVIGRPPAKSAGRSEFGMGLKTAAIWFATEIEIRTKKLGEAEEIRASLKVDDFVAGDSDLEIIRTPKPADEHYTILELRKLQRRLGQSSLEKTRTFLGSIYRHDLRSGSMRLTVNSQEIATPAAATEDKFMTRSDGSKILVEFADLEVNQRKVSGWVGVLRPGYTGRNHAGFALLRHNRAVRGWLDSWRPEEIFGDARNDTINQRLTGELIMNEFRASHTKDAIDWEGDDEEVLGEKLRELCAHHDLLRAAKKKISGDDTEDTQIERNEAQARLNEQLKSHKVEDTIRLLDVPRPELARVASEVLIDAIEAEGASPVAIWEVAQGRLARMYEVRLSPNDPYYEYEVLASADLKVVINASHPGMSLLSSAEARLAHYHHVVLDAVAEWKCAQQNEPLDPSSIRLMKDRLFRAVSEADDSL